jgi:transposase-like protein
MFPVSYRELALMLRNRGVEDDHSALFRWIVDKNPAYPKATREMRREGELWRRSRLRQCKFLNNIVEQDHRRTRRLVRPGMGFGSFHTARRTLAGFEVMAIFRKGQVRRVGGCDMQIQARLIARLFQMAAGFTSYCGGL